jgi:sensor domain CHASE-containing protein
MNAMERTTAVHRGDLVFVNQSGRLFYAKVVGVAADARLAIEPLDRRSARARLSRPRSSIIGRAAARVIAARRSGSSRSRICSA